MNRYAIPREWYERWWEPSGLLAAAHAVRRSVAPDELFGSSHFQPVREAISASEFASRHPWNRRWEIRLASGQFPDFELRESGEIRQFEVVEADRLGRKRGKEYKDAAKRASQGLSSQWEHYDPDEEAELALRTIAQRIQQKVDKRYSPPAPHLLVHVNLSEGEPTELYGGKLAGEFSASFASAWLLWQRGVFRLWPNPAKMRVIPLCPNLLQALVFYWASSILSHFFPRVLRIH